MTDPTTGPEPGVAPGDSVPDEPAVPPADAPGGAADAEPRGRSGWMMLTTALAVVFAAVAVLLAVITVRLQSDLDDVRGDRSEIERVAGQFSEALLTYDHQDLDAARERVLALSTGRFRREYEEAFEGLAALVERFEASSAATVKAIFVGDVSDGAAEAITVVDAVIEGTGGPRPLLDSYIRLDLVKVEGQWRVDFVTSLSFAEEESLPLPSEDRPGEDEAGEEPDDPADEGGGSG